MNEQEIMHVDATPDGEYPLRILRVYRERCNSRWSSTWGSVSNQEENPVCVAMNKWQDERAEILDKAIAILEEHMRGYYFSC